MSWWDDITSTVGGWFDDGDPDTGFWGDKGWLDRNQGWMKPVAGFAAGAYQISQQDKATRRTADLLAQQEQMNYDQSKLNYEAYQDYLARWNEADAANRASANAARAAYAAAARQEAANRLAAMKKAKKRHAKGIRRAQAKLDPYVQSGYRILPVMEDTYTQSALKMQDLLKMLTNEEGLARLDEAQPAAAVTIPLPDIIKSKKAKKEEDGAET